VSVAGDPTVGVELVGVTEASRLLGVSPQWVRRQAAGGQLGARQVGGRWLLDMDAVTDEAARRRRELQRRLPADPASSGNLSAAAAGPRPDPVPVVAPVGEWERESWALERQLLLAQADAAERRAQLAQLEATITQRDATIAAMQSEIGRLRGERDRWQHVASGLLATFSSETGETLP
jgi:hypothetical protein